ncbi:hypothetical protein Tco_1523675 [Tanacetum coccineum]
MAQASSEICIGFDLEPDEWIKDSGCSKHMTGNRKLFSTYKAYNRGASFLVVIFAVTSLAKVKYVIVSENDSEIVKDGKETGRDEEEEIKVTEKKNLEITLRMDMYGYAKITRKRSKQDKHEHGNEKNEQEPEVF